MDIDIGKKCNICKQLDYVPFQCDICCLWFCLEHWTSHMRQEKDMKKDKKV